MRHNAEEELEELKEEFQERLGQADRTIAALQVSFRHCMHKIITVSARSCVS